MLKKFMSNTVKGDISGGITSAVITLPTAIGYGIIVFSPLGIEYAPMAALTGVYAAVFAGFFAALFGGSPIQITAPGAAQTLVLSTFVAGVVSNPAIGVSPEIVLGLVSLCVLLSGVIQIVFGLLGLSNLVKYIPKPVISGFVNGIALLIIFSQLFEILGAEGANTFLDIFGDPMNINPITTLVGIITILSMYISKRFSKSLPYFLIGLITGTGVYYLLILIFPESPSGQIVGVLQNHFPLPLVFWNLYNEANFSLIKSIFPQLMVTSFVLSITGSLASMLSAAVADNLSGIRHNSKRVILGQGIGNIAGSFFGAIASAGSIVQSTANHKAGGRTSLSGMLSSIFNLLIMLIFGAYADMIPVTVVAGIVFFVGINMFDKWTLNTVKKIILSFNCPKEIRADLLITLFVVVITISINLIAAVGVGLLVATALFISKVGHSVIKRHYLADHFHSRKMRPTEHIKFLEKKGSCISVLQLQGPLFFGSAEHLSGELHKTMGQASFIILDFKRVSDIDSTGAAILLRLQKDISKEKKYLLFAHLQSNKSVWTFIKTMGVSDQLANGTLFSDTDMAIEWAEDRLLFVEQIEDGFFPEFDLGRVSLFENFTNDELEAVKAILVHEVFGKGDTVFREKGNCRDLYILIKGLMTVEVYLPETNRQKRLFTYSSGISFGEMSFLDGSPRSAGVWACGDSEVFRLPFDDFERLAKRKPEIAHKLFKNIALEISYYLRKTSQQVSELEDD